MGGRGEVGGGSPGDERSLSSAGYAGQSWLDTSTGAVTVGDITNCSDTSTGAGTGTGAGIVGGITLQRLRNWCSLRRRRRRRLDSGATAALSDAAVALPLLGVVVTGNAVAVLPVTVTGCTAVALPLPCGTMAALPLPGVIFTGHEKKFLHCERSSQGWLMQKTNF